MKDKPNYIIIRGPLGCGKSTISKELARDIHAEHISVDNILDEFHLTNDKEEGYVSQKSFFRANEIAAQRAQKFLEQGKPVIFDGNFYWRSAVEDLSQRLHYPHQTFTLQASVETCIARDEARGRTHGEIAARVVHKKSTEFTYGEVIDTENKTARQVVEEIERKLNVENK